MKIDLVLEEEELKRLIYELERHKYQLGYDGARWETIEFVRVMIAKLKEYL